VQRQPVSVEDVLLEAFERLQQQAQGRLHLSEPAADSLPLAQGDPERLQQCLAALIDNALRYTSGPITLSAEHRPARRTLVLHVEDSGPGVGAAERETIFERFVRGSASINTRGSGLGLSVVRLLMEAMAGSATVACAEGGGADFQLELPQTGRARAPLQGRGGPSLSMKPTPRTV
jgi:two-component system OmpR family sensor kinase